MMIKGKIGWVSSSRPLGKAHVSFSSLRRDIWYGIPLPYHTHTPLTSDQFSSVQGGTFLAFLLVGRHKMDNPAYN